MNITEGFGSKAKTIVFRVFSILLIIGGVVYLIFNIIENHQRMNNMASYLEVTAVIDSIDNRNGHKTRTVGNYYANVHYTVNGVTYKSVRVILTNGFLKKGDTVTVYCNPDDPSEVSGLPNTIDRIGNLSRGIIAVILGIIFFLLSFLTVKNNALRFFGMPIKVLKQPSSSSSASYNQYNDKGF
ncbi:MAG: DUF3592 domain-containing protein [Clostridia bacterium]|nr:DUF3592 domain-containing protein [Clostridia bacterium]